MKRSLLILVAMFGCAPESSLSPPVLSSRYDAQFVASGARHGVPPIVLQVTAQALTRTQMIDGDGEELGRPSTFGVMAIPADRIDDSNAKTDAAANIELAAKLLSRRADELKIDRTELRAWATVIADYAHTDDPEFLRDEVLKPLGVLTPDDLASVKRQALSPDYDLGIWRPSPNFNSRNGRTPQFVIIHTCEGAYSGCWGWQTNPASQVSAHYTVSDGSEVTQLVRESDRAWHVAATYDCANNGGVRCDLNGISTNTIAVGIEHAGYASQASFPASQIDASARLVCSITQRWGIPRDRNHILSHGQLQPNNRTDPGPNWPWDAFITKVQDVCGDHPPPCDRTAGPFTFSCDGAQPAQTCVNLNEPSDPDTWNDNFLCTPNDYGFRWSFTGPIDGMDCTNVNEGAEPLASIWSDNYFCAPKQSPWIVSYSSAGPIDGKTCVQLNEPADLANSWGDNFLCFEPRSVFTEGELSFSMAGAPGDRSCINVATDDPDTWADNWLCGERELGFSWSTTGPQDGKRCTAITEPADATPAAWANTYLCTPMNSAYRFTWSSAGPIAGQQCLRWFDHSESATWLDNWLCFVVVDVPPERPPAPVMSEVDSLTNTLGDDSMVRGGCSSTGIALSALALFLLRKRVVTKANASKM
ncbi:MAG: peptidoglycan recognition family protein [Archangium sp.]